MIGTAILHALDGLRAASKRSEVASRNIAGHTVQGYARKEAVVSSGPLGLEFKGVVRAEDLHLFREAARERGALAGVEAELAAQTALVGAMGDPRVGDDLGSALNRLAQALTRLGGQPEDGTLQRDAVGRAGDVATKLHELTRAVQGERLAADGAIVREVAAANGELRAIDDLNARIAALPAGGGDRTELQDQRDRALAALAGRLPVRATEGADGKLTVMTEEGVTLVTPAGFAELGFAGAQAMAPGMGLAAGTLSGLDVGGFDVTPGSGRPQAPDAGSLHGLFAARDAAMPRAQAQLDELASALAAAFQAADGTVADPAAEAGLFADGAGADLPHDRTDPAQILGFAGRIAVHARVDPDRGGEPWRLRTGVHATAPGEPGEGAQARAFAGVFGAAQAFDAGAGLATEARLVDWANQVTADQGARKTTLEDEAEYKTSLAGALDARLTDRRGVDLDKELQDVLMFERSYSASASVLQAAQRMLDELLAAV